MAWKIGVIGLGFVGLTLATALTSKGFDVVGVDIDEHKVKCINGGKPPFYEKELDKYLKTVINKKLIVSTDYRLLSDADIAFITVGTPTNPNGTQNQTFLKEAVNELGRVWRNSSSKKYRLLVVKSTVVPGTTRKLGYMLSMVSGLKLGSQLGVVMNPEFLREGNALYDIFYPSRVVIGCIDERSCSVIKELWTKFYESIGTSVPIITLSLEEAELVKYASNSFLALRISFANTIANICEKIKNCDVINVLKAVGLDPRIGTRYLRPGLGYGGSCLPKDLKALIRFSRTRSYNPILLEAVDKVNEEQPYKAIEYLMREYKDLKDRTIGILGLSFKPGTDDIRDAVSLKVIRKLLELGAKVKVHDPLAIDNTRKIFGKKLVYCSSPEEVLRDADAVIIITEWDEYKELKPKVFKELMRSPVVIDGRRIHDPAVFNKEKIKYHAIGLHI